MAERFVISCVGSELKGSIMGIGRQVIRSQGAN